MDVGKTVRFRRVFRRGRAVIVPMDHAIYSGPMPGLEDMGALVRMVARAGADAILITPGTLRKVADDLGDLGVILRMDGTHSRLTRHLERVWTIRSVEQCVRLGADMVVINVYCGTNNEDRLLEKLGLVAEEGERWGVPVVGEMIPAALLDQHYGRGESALNLEEMTSHIALAARIGAEIGADVIKTRYTGDPKSFRDVTAGAMVPVILAGGPKTESEEDVLRMVWGAMQSGARGICIGRNVWQREDAESLLRAIVAIVHDDASMDEAMSVFCSSR